MFDTASELAAQPHDADANGALDVSYCTPTYIEVARASCLLEMHEPAQAITLFRTELAALPRGFRNDYGVYLARLARAHAADGDPEQSATVATQALAIAYDTESARALSELAATERAVAGWADVPAVRTFRERLHSIRAQVSAVPPQVRR